MYIGLQKVFIHQDVLLGKIGVKTVLFDRMSKINTFYTYSAAGFA